MAQTSTLVADGTATRASRGSLSAWSGIAAAVIGIFATLLSGIDVSVGEREANPAGAAVNGFEGSATALKAAAALGFVAAGLLVVFAAGLRLRLAASLPPASAVPAVAWAGAVVTAAMLSASAIVSATAGTLVDDAYRDTTLEVFVALSNNVAFAAWVPLGLTMAAAAVASIRYQAAARWLGVASAITLTALAVAVAVGLPFASWAIGAAWLLLAGVALALGPRSST